MQVTGEKKNKIRIFVICALLVLVTIASISSIRAKYIKKQELEAYVHFNDELAESMTLLESKAVVESDGIYQLDSDIKVTGNGYCVIPGVTIPKDPAIKVHGRTAIPAYLYVEVEQGGLPSTIHFSMADNWHKLTGLTGPNGGDLYVYTAELVDDTEMHLIKNDALTVDADYDPTTPEFRLNFHAYLIQKVGDQLPEQVFASIYAA